VVTASAQTAPAGGENFSGLLGGRTVSVIDDSGRETTGRLLLFTQDTLTMKVNGGDVVFDRKNVAAVFERGNSVKKGLIIGALSGPALGLVALATDGPSAELAVGTLIFSAIGVGVGVAVDAMIPGKRLVYAAADAFERKDSNKNGMILGFIAGAGLGFVAGLTKDDCDHTPTTGPAYFVPLDCSAGEKIVHGLKVAALPGLAGAGIGFMIDRKIAGWQLRNRISISPSLSRAGLGVSTRVSW
jgi:hypothetical protein